ncbi:MAG: ABC transporter permease [Spirochaetia bacterium]|nr:ABC transporter permease [Spirochaetia bacterium]
MRYIIKKLLSALLTLFLASVITFSIFNILPGDPAQVILGIDASDQQLEQLRETMNIDAPPVYRYIEWLNNISKGDFGISYKYQTQVSSLISQSLKVTLQLSFFSLILTVLISIPFGLLLVSLRNKKSFIPLSLLSQFGMSIPSFCIAILLIGIFTVKLRILPSIGYISFSENPLQNIRSLLLPSFSIAIGASSIVVRYLNTSVQQQLKKDYVRTAYSIGLSEKTVLYHHVLRNALIPVITIFGLIIADILGGSIIIENVFSLPGIGKLITSSITSRDLPLIQALVLYLSFLVIVVNFFVDVLYKIIDPRIRIE